MADEINVVLDWETVQLNVPVSKQLKQRLQRLAIDLDTNLKYIVEPVLKKWADEKEAELKNAK